MLRKSLLVCGALASILYIGADLLAAAVHGGYHSFTSLTISELMATGSPTERLVDPLFLLYGVLMMAFGAGVWMSSPRARVHTTGALLIAYGAVCLTGPTLFEVEVRNAAGGGLSTAGALHIAATAVMVLLVMAAIVAGSAIRGRRFRNYSYATLAVLVVFGALTGIAGRGITTGEPTPWVGILERVEIGALLAWVAVLAVALLRATTSTAPVLPPWAAAHRH